jgi:NAD(P)H-hydrate epimerase
MRSINHACLKGFLTVEQCRSVDEYAIEQLGIPGIVLMENAGRNAADLIETWASLPDDAPRRVALLCGKGNNGGDGFVIARQLCNRGWQAKVVLVGDPDGLGGDAATNHAICQAMGIETVVFSEASQLDSISRQMSESDVIVDALLGTGFEGSVREPMASLIEAANGLTSPMVVAVDVPSGLNADTGTCEGAGIRADHTVTFLAGKKGFRVADADRYTGRVTVCDIGAPLTMILERLNINPVE